MNSDTPDRPMAETRTEAPASVAEMCAGCQRPLTRRGSHGECLRCLLGFAFAPDEEPPVDAVPEAGRGTLRYGHFEVATAADGSPVELGSGGMAVTYRALDTVLDHAVALKVIHRKVAGQPAARARFLREARAAAKLHHPNVASVSHYGEQDGECYYVMELVEGETLEARVRREGPLSPALALEVGIQVARALAAAEACGVVHRDLKPSNLMLATHQGVTGEANPFAVKVIDWGLVKAVTAQSPLVADHTRGGFVGTPAFASPEQFAAASDSRIDTRSDIYSLGVTLWYLLCGRSPFVGRTLEEIHDRQVGAPPLEQLVTARVPRRVVALLASMVAAVPAARPQSARELLDALHRCQKAFPIKDVRTTHRRGRLWRGASLGLIAALAISLGIRAYRAAPSAALADRSIAILPFENLSPDKADAFFAVGVQDEITADLARIATLKVIGSESTRSYDPGGRDPARIGRELGVSQLLEGSVKRTDGQVQVAVRLVDVHDLAHPWAERYDRRLTDVFAVQGEITRAVAARLHAPLTPNEKAAIDAPPTSDLAAYDLYLRAREGPQIFQSPGDARRSYASRIPLLEAAVARDPGFAFAYCELAKAHDALYRHGLGATPDEQAVDHRGLAETALANARRLRPDAGEVHLAQANHFLRTSHENEQARIEVDLARSTLPNTAEVEEIAGEIARNQDHWEEALRCLQRAVALEPRENVNRFTLANTYRLMRRYEEFGAPDRSCHRHPDPPGFGGIPAFPWLGRHGAAGGFGPVARGDQRDRARRRTQRRTHRRVRPPPGPRRTRRRGGVPHPRRHQPGSLPVQRGPLPESLVRGARGEDARRSRQRADGLCRGPDRGESNRASQPDERADVEPAGHDRRGPRQRGTTPCARPAVPANRCRSGNGRWTRRLPRLIWRWFTPGRASRIWRVPCWKHGWADPPGATCPRSQPTAICG